MTHPEHTEILDLIDRYNSIEPKTIQKNIAYYIKESKYTSQEVANKTEIVKKSTVDSWRNLKKNMKIDFETALKVAYVLNISIEDLMEE